MLPFFFHLDLKSLNWGLKKRDSLKRIQKKKKETQAAIINSTILIDRISKFKYDKILIGWIWSFFFLSPYVKLLNRPWERERKNLNTFPVCWSVGLARLTWSLKWRTTHQFYLYLCSLYPSCFLLYPFRICLWY